MKNPSSSAAKFYIMSSIEEKITKNQWSIDHAQGLISYRRNDCYVTAGDHVKTPSGLLV